MIPVSVLTGFLGSGKTTLLGRLLRHPNMSRTAVIVNELGEIALDHDLIETSDESFVQLSNGCLCCNVRSDLTLTLSDLAVRRRRGTVPAFDRVVIETSGLADPAPILHALMTDPGLCEVYALEAVITTVDAITGESTLANHCESLRQVAMADRIVLTKTDVMPSPPTTLIERVSKINPDCSIIDASLGDMTPSRLFGDDERQSQSADVPSWLTRAIRRAADGPSADHAHSADITHFCIVRDEPVHAVTLALFVSALAENCGPDLLRTKGIVHILEEPLRPAVIHGVQHVYHAPVWLDRWPSEDRRTRMVFIGRHVPEKWVRCLLDLLDDEVAQETKTREARAFAMESTQDAPIRI